MMRITERAVERLKRNGYIRNTQVLGWAWVISTTEMMRSYCAMD